MPVEAPPAVIEKVEPIVEFIPTSSVIEFAPTASVIVDNYEIEPILEPPTELDPVETVAEDIIVEEAPTDPPKVFEDAFFNSYFKKR